MSSAKKQKNSYGSYANGDPGDSKVKNDSLNYVYDLPRKLKRPDILNHAVREIKPDQKLIATTATSDVNSCTQLDFNVESEKMIEAGINTRFEIKFHVERKKDAAGSLWEKIPKADLATEVTNTMLVPGWIDFLVKQLDIYHNNSLIVTSNEVPYIASYMDRFVDTIQHKKVTKLFAPQEHHPYRYALPMYPNCVDITKDHWSNYGKLIFESATAHRIDWWPRKFFFMNGLNFIADDGSPRAIPFPNLGSGKLNIRLTFCDDWSGLFRNKDDTHKTKYRIVLTSFNLLLDESKLYHTLERRLLTSKGMHYFPGVTKTMSHVIIPSNSPTYNCRFSDVPIPEAVLIFCIPKNVANGSYKFRDAAEKNWFLPHNIETVELSFNNMRFYNKDPHIGNLNKDMFDYERLRNFMDTPPFGVIADKEVDKLDYFANGSGNTAFPHVYIPLTPRNTVNTRLVPVHDDGNKLEKTGNFDIYTKMSASGANSDVTYVFCLINTDYNNTFDAKTKKFSNPRVAYHHHQH